MSRFIQIVEVGPRDGLQNEKLSLSVDEKLDLIRKLEAAGAKRTEVVSFVNPNRVPQMAGAEEIMAALPSDLEHSRIGLVLNMRGWERCVAAQCDEANVVVCASDGFGVANQGATVRQQIDTLAAIAERQAVEGGPPITATISVAFGCPFDGEVSEDQVVAIVREAAALGVPEIAIADTIGVADPWTVRKRIEAARAAAPNTRLRMHFHDTRNTGLANAYASVEAGVGVLDASVGGLGGCPFAPNATGNIGTEDLVYMLERAGFETGYDLAALIEIGREISAKLGKAPASSLARAGRLPRMTIRLAVALALGLSACVAASPDAAPTGAARCDVTIKFGSYGMGIDQPLAATVADMVKTDPDIARSERRPWGREGEFDQCLTAKSGRNVKALYERYRAILPAKNVKAPTSIEGPDGLRFETIGPM